MKTARASLLVFVSLLSGMDPKGTPPQFGPTVYYPIVPTNYRIGTFFKAVDVNEDGITDLIIVAPGGSTISALLGEGSGKFGKRLDSEIGAVVYAGGNVATGDFNGDGHLDLIIAMNNSPLQLMTGDGKGRFSLGTTLERVGPIVDCPGPVVATDVDHDGKLDIVANQCGGGVAVFLGKGDGKFSSPIKVAVANLNHAIDQSMAVTDFNNDGIPDIAVSTLTGIAVLTGKGDGTFNPQFDLETGCPLKFVAGDVNDDKNADLIVMPTDPDLNPAPMFGAAGNHIVVYLGDGKGKFKALPRAPAVLSQFSGDGGYAYHIELADVNGDRVPDLAITKQQYSHEKNLREIRFIVMLGRGDGTFPTTAEFPNPPHPKSRRYPSYAFLLADLNGDKRPDLAFLDDRTGNQIGVTLNVNRAVLTISSSRLAPAIIGKPYSQSLAAAGGGPPYKWSMVSGALPAGLTLTPAGAITGTATAAGSFTFVVKVMGSSPATATKTFVLQVKPVGDSTR